MIPHGAGMFWETYKQHVKAVTQPGEKSGYNKQHGSEPQIF
jgi:hypothetical protein